MKNIILVIFLGVLVSSCHSQSVIVIGIDPTNPPFEWQNQEGQLQGESVQMAKTFAKMEQVKIQLRSIPWRALIPSLQSNQIQMIISSMSVTPERNRWVIFSKPYSYTALGIISLKSRPIKNLSQLKQLSSVATICDTTSASYMHQHYPHIKIKCYHSVEQGRQSLLAQHVQAFVFDKSSLKNINNASMYLYPGILPGSQQAIAVAVSPHHPLLLEKVNHFIREWTKKKTPELRN